MNVTCEARTGYRAGEFGEVPAWCNRSIALGSFEDAQGVIRHACQAPGHRAMVERLYGVMSEQADGLTRAKARQLLEQGTAYFDVDEDDEPDEEWTNREGMPEFNGAFR